MKALVAMVVLLLCETPALADEVPQDSLASLSLGQMQRMTDAEAMAVRGRASTFVSAAGASFIFGQLATEDFQNVVVSSSGNQVAGNGETTAAGGTLSIEKDHNVTLDVALQVTIDDVTVFSGAITGSAGGTGMVVVTQP